MIRNALSLSALMLAISSGLAAQEQTVGGAATSGAKVYTSRRTTGIIDPNAQKVFEDVAQNTAIKDFKCVSGGAAKDYIVETTACTVAVLDYDNDGRPDIFFLNGSTIEAEKGMEKPPKSQLFRNLGEWKFENVTQQAGVSNERWGMGVTVADYNNDGFADIFVSNYGVPRLYKNNGNGTFTDVAPTVGLAMKGWHTGATFGDYDKDGRHDLFVPAYLEYDLNDLPSSPRDVANSQSVSNSFCQFRGQPVMCGPRGLTGAKDRLFHQKDDGTFEEVGDKIGVTDEDRYYGFSSVFIDVDDDNDQDLLVVNDSTPKQLYLNDGNGSFEEFGYPSGIALSENGREQAGMGLGVGDYDNDGRVDFHITNFSDDSNTLYRNDGEGSFTDITFQAGLGEPTIPFLGWGTSFLDFDNDGWLDILIANAHVYPIVDKYQWGTSFAQQLLLFRSHKDSATRRVRFQKVGAAPNSALAVSLNVRGLAVADFDGDGKLDAVTNNMDSVPTLLRNVSKSENNWLRIRLVGNSELGTPTDAIGSKVFVKVGPNRLRFDLTSGAGYASQNEQVAHFGLGKIGKVDEIEIVWANGKTEKFTPAEINKTLTIQQGKGIVSN